MPSRRSTRLAVLAVLALLPAVAACEKAVPTVRQSDNGQLVLGDAEVLETTERSVTPGARAIHIDGFNGTLDIGVSDGPTALLRFTRRARGTDEATAADVLAGVTVTEADEAARYRFTLAATDPALAAVDVRGTVPRGTNLELRLASGTVAVRGVGGPLLVTIENGTVQVTGAAAPLDVRAQNGTLDVSLSRLGNGVTVSTANGAISLGLPLDADATVSAETQLGRVLDTGLDIRDRRLDESGVGARLTGRMGRGAFRIAAASLNGDITLHPAFPDAPAPDTLTGAIPAAPRTPRADTARLPPMRRPGPPRDTGLAVPDPGIRLPDTLRLPRQR